MDALNEIEKVYEEVGLCIVPEIKALVDQQLAASTQADQLCKVISLCTA
jgi:hypothetical protein